MVSFVLHVVFSEDSSLTSVEGAKTMVLEPRRGADADCDEADDEVEQIEGGLEQIRLQMTKQLKLVFLIQKSPKSKLMVIRTKDIVYWNSAQGGKEIYQLQIPAGVKVPMSWSKQSATKVCLPAT